MYKKFVSWLNSLRRDRLYHFIAGMIIAAFFALTLHTAVGALMAAIFVGFFKELHDAWQDGNLFDADDLFATFLGGAVIFFFAIL